MLYWNIYKILIKNLSNYIKSNHKFMFFTKIYTHNAINRTHYSLQQNLRHSQSTGDTINSHIDPYHKNYWKFNQTSVKSMNKKFSSVQIKLNRFSKKLFNSYKYIITHCKNIRNSKFKRSLSPFYRLL